MKLHSLVGKWLRSGLLGAILVVAPLQAAFASLILINDRDAIQTDYVVDWSVLGGDLTAVGSPITLDTTTVSGASAFGVFSGSTYNADFAATDAVLALYDLNTFDPLNGIFSISFAYAIQGAGAQVQANQFGAFNGVIRAFNAANLLLGQFAINGTNGGNGNGSAIFAGVISNTSDITRIEFANFGSGAAINALSVDVPEPSVWLMLLIGLGFLTFIRKRVK